MKEAIIDQLDRLIASHSILQHPFYQAWAMGELQREALMVYAWGYYPHVEAFLGYLEIALRKTEDPEIRRILLENLEEETGDHENQSHPELWLHFAEGMGIGRSEVLISEPIPEVQKAIGIFQRLCQEDPVSALSALYVYESQQPEVSTLKIEGLQQHYQIHAPQTLSYFTVHQEADLRHREEARGCLLHSLEQGVPSHILFESAQTALDAHWLLLDGICRQSGLHC